MRAAQDVEDLDVAIADLERQLAALKRQRADRQAARFLETLARSIPIGLPFTAGEVLAHAPLSPELAAAIGSRDAHRLGMYLSKLERKCLMLSDITGVVLERIGRDELGCCWHLRASV